jgi:MFS transporter, SP family, galactose:H+ symporter
MSRSPPNPPRTVLAALSCSLGGLIAGFHLAALSGLLTTPAFTSLLAPTTATASFLSSAFVLGSVLFALPAGPLSDIWGRRPALLLVAFLASLSALAMSTTSSPSVFALARAAAGASFALASVVCPTYLSEIAPKNLRGAYVSLFQLAITIGILFVQLVNLAVARETLSFRAPLQTALLPSITMLVCVMLFAPETPAWLSSSSASSLSPSSSAASPSSSSLPRHSSVSALPTASVSDDDDDTRDVERDLLSEKPRKSSSPSVLLADPTARRRFGIAIGLALGQQLTGVNSVIFYAPTIVTALAAASGVRLSPDSPALATVIIGSLNLVATVASFAIIDRVPRRLILLVSAVPLILALAVLAASPALALPPAASVAAILVFVAAFAVGWGPVPFLISSEVFPVHYRGRGMTAASLAASLGSLVVTSSFLPLSEAYGGSAVYSSFALCTVFALLFVYFRVPETKDVSLGRIEALLRAVP